MTTDPSLNPYASPSPSGLAQPAADPRLGVYSAVVSPRDVVDIVVGGSFAGVFALAIYGIPLAILWYFGMPLLAYATVVIVILAIAMVAMLAGIHSVELNDQGLIARRRILPSIRVGWSDVLSLDRAGRDTVLLSTVYLPHRCCSFSLTSRDQFQIRIRGRGTDWHFLFPPRDSAAFRATMEWMMVVSRQPSVG